MKEENKMGFEFANDFMILFFKGLIFLGTIIGICYLGSEIHWAFYSLILVWIYILIFLFGKFTGVGVY